MVEIKNKKLEGLIYNTLIHTIYVYKNYLKDKEALGDDERRAILTVTVIDIFRFYEASKGKIPKYLNDLRNKYVGHFTTSNNLTDEELTFDFVETKLDTYIKDIDWWLFAKTNDWRFRVDQI